VKRKLEARKDDAKVETELVQSMSSGRVLARLASRPGKNLILTAGQSGRGDGYILEGKELEFYLKKIRSRKG
jgi:small subunit ribosomal protein S8e